MKKIITAFAALIFIMTGLFALCNICRASEGVFDVPEGFDIATVRYVKNDGSYGFAIMTEDGTAYSLPEELSSYTVVGEYTSDQNWEVPSAENELVIVAELYSLARWDGAVDISWYDASQDEFYLSYPAQLAGLAAIVNGSVDVYTPDYRIKGDQSLLQQIRNDNSSFIQVSGAISYFGCKENDFSDKTVYLTADMDMGGDTDNLAPKDQPSSSIIWPEEREGVRLDEESEETLQVNWAPIGGLFVMDINETGKDPHLVQSVFNGVLDGQGHKVFNLYCNRFSKKGYSYSQGIGFIGNIGGIYSEQEDELPEQDPAVRNLSVDGYIYGRRLVAGIVGHVGGNVASKSGSGAGSQGSSSSTESEKAYVKIENCANHANVFSTDSKGTGGVVAGGWGDGHIINCYNTGNITSAYASAPMGGICGSNSGMDIYNCYNTGKITSVNPERARAIGSDNGGGYSVDDCYFLEGSDGNNVYEGWYLPSNAKNTYVNVKKLTESEMTDVSFADSLNNNGTAYAYADGSCPVLIWEVKEESTIYTVTINDPEYEDENTGEVSTAVTISADHTRAAAGTVICFSNKESDGFSFRKYTVNGKEVTGSHYTIDGDIVVSAVFELKLPGVLRIPESDIYTVRVLKTGYEPDPDRDGVLVRVENKEVFDLEPLYEKDRLTVQTTLKDGAQPSDINYIFNASAANPYTCYFTYENDPDNPVKTYSGYHEVSQSISENGNFITLTVEIATIHKDWTQIYDQEWADSVTSAYDSQDTFEISNAKELAAFRKLVDEGTNFENKTVTLTNDISLDNMKEGDSKGVRWWKSIGLVSGSTDHSFKGTFDGAGYTISDMVCVNAGSGGGLFSFTSGAAIRNLTVRGTSEAVGNIAGIVAVGEDTVIENCINYVTVTGKASSTGAYSRYAGGIAASLTGNSVLRNCVNYGIITDSDGVGGIAGNVASGGSITDCINMGSVVAMGTGQYGCGGIAGMTANLCITRCANYSTVSGSDMYVGGITGVANGSAQTGNTIITDCYNVGIVRSSSLVSRSSLGGIAGYGNFFEVTNSYNAGKLMDVYGSVQHKGAFIGLDARKSTNYSDNVYYLDSTCEYAADNQEEAPVTAVAVSVTAEELAGDEFLAKLNKNGCFATVNSKYPEFTTIPASDDDKIFAVYEKYGLETRKLVSEYRLQDMYAIASSWPVVIWQYGTKGESVVVSTVFDTIDDLAEVNDIAFTEGDTLEVLMSGDPYTVDWNELQSCRYYVIRNDGQEDVLIEVPAAIAIDWGQSNSSVEEGLADIKPYSQRTQLRFGYGSDPEVEMSMTRGFRLVTGVNSITFVHPARIIAETVENGIGLSWGEMEKAESFELQKRLDNGSWDKIWESGDELEYSYTDQDGENGKTYSYRMLIWYYGEDGTLTSMYTSIASAMMPVHVEITAADRHLGETEEDQKVEDIEVSIDGKATDENTLTAPGKHAVRISAAGYTDMDFTFSLDEEGKLIYEGEETELLVIDLTGNVSDMAVHSLEHFEAKAADCTNDGAEEYWRCSVCEKMFGDEKNADSETGTVPVIAAKGHSYDEPVWEWAEDHSSATAKATCANDSAHVTEVSASVTSETTEATASAEGKTVYTAKVTIEGREYTDTKTVVIPKLTPEEPASEPEEPATPAEEPAAPAEDPTTPAEEPAVPAGTMFSDVPDSSSIFKPVNWAVKNNIVKGFSDGTFKPEDSCTREQFAIMMWRFAGQPDADISAADRFTDIASFSNNTSRKAVAWAVDEGIINGFNDGHFGPQETVTRRQVVVMLWRWAGRPAATAAASFTDVQSSESTYKAIQWGVEAGLVKGYSDGTFRPEDDCQRQHIVIFLYRFARDVRGENVN